MKTNWLAKWIWHKGEESPRNAYWCARQTFEVSDGSNCVQAFITADSRYSLWVNGTYIGHGPVRGFAHNWRYDTYDITPYVQVGRNAIAVIVQHYGHSTLQYIETRGGLLAQIESDGRIVAATDASWRSMLHPSYNRRTARMSLQQAWTEEFDARREPVGWCLPEFDDSACEYAVVVGEAGCEPWKKLSPRDITFLTQTQFYPSRLINTRLVRSPRQVWSMDLKPNLAPGNLSANPCEIPGLVGTVMNCSQRMQISINMFRNSFCAMYIDGAEVSVKDAADGVVLEQGDHLFLVDTSNSVYHEWFATFVMEYLEGELELRSPIPEVNDYPFVTLGPLKADEPARELALKLTTAKDIAEYPGTKPISFDHISESNVSAMTEMAHVCSGNASVVDSEAMFASNCNVTKVYPSSAGDTELIIDFGEEVVGFIELDICAPAGAVIDFNGFENIQDGRIQWTGYMLSNSFRYISRDGWQTWRSVVRRGFRYASLTLRFPDGCTEPVLLKSVRCYLNTYPYPNRGIFQSSDELLNKIWDISKRTVTLCSEDTYVDCPAFEQIFWVGDSRNESLFAYMLFGDYDLARRCLLLAGESLYRSPIVESHVPSGWVNIIPAWSFLWTIACEEYYKYTADRSFLEEVYPAISLQNANIYEHFINKDGLFEIEAWNFLDWAPMDAPESGVVTHQSMWLVESLRRSAEIARVLGNFEDKSMFKKQADALNNAIIEHMWDDENEAFIDCIHEDGTRSKVFSQQTQTVAYLCNVIPDGKSDRLVHYLTDVPEGWVKIGSPFMTAFTIEALYKAGNVVSILSLIRRWWGLMISSGDTTCWETFPDSVSDEWNTRSYCHAWSAAPAYALPAYVLGVRPLEPGFKLFEVKPYLENMKSARGAVPTPHGEIELEVHRDYRKTVVSIVVPQGTSAFIGDHTYPAGNHTVYLPEPSDDPATIACKDLITTTHGW